MKNIIKSINPKHLFRSKKSPKSVSKSSPPSFGSSSHSSTTSSSSSDTSDTSHHHLHHHRVTRTRSSNALVVTTAETATTTYKFDAISAFKMIDTDGDGKITRRELESLFVRLMPISSDELVEMIKELDRDGDGCISLDELLHSAVGSVFETTAVEDEDELRGAFEFFDVDGDGKIDAGELYEGLAKLGDQRCSLEDCKRMIQSVDLNQDGFVCFQDFSRMMDVIPR